MDSVCKSNDALDTLVPYDPKYLPAKAFLAANENTDDISPEVRRVIEMKLSDLSFNRYPDPLANVLREKIAAGNGIERNQVLVGNGGDELLFNLALAWGGSGRKFINLPPTFSVYAQNARLTQTEMIDIARNQDYSIAEQAVLDRIGQGDINFIVVTSPNNPTGNLADSDFIERLLRTSNALVMVDEAYCEFSQTSVLPLLRSHKNLVILRTFSKAYSLAGVRLGYIMAHEEVIDEFIKVRQPYSVDSLSQVIGSCVFDHRCNFTAKIDRIIEERKRVYNELKRIDQVEVYPSSANFLLFKTPDAANVWERLYDHGVLVRDFSSTPGLRDCLRVTIGSSEENSLFLSELHRVF